MSNQTNSFSSPINEEIVKNIDQLNLPASQKHHIRLLAHCLAILKEIATEENDVFEEYKLLRKWCEAQSQKFNDRTFDQLFYEQMSSAAKKINSFSLTQQKKFQELDFQDLIILVKQNNIK